MPWTETTRAQYRHESLRYASDLTDAEWSPVAAHLPACAPVGRPREVELRDVLDAIMYIALDWLPVATVAKGFPGRPIRRCRGISTLGAAGTLADDQSRPGHGVAREGSTRGQSDGRRDRQPIRENLRKQRSARIRRQ